MKILVLGGTRFFGIPMVNALLEEYHAPVVSFTMNIAGPVKVTALSRRAFLWGMEQLRLGFLQNRMPVLKEHSRSLSTGDEGYFAVRAPPRRPSKPSAWRSRKAPRTWAVFMT